MAKEQPNIAVIAGIVLIVALISLGIGSTVFANETIVTETQIKEVPIDRVIVEPFKYSELLDECPDCIVCDATESTTEIIEFTPIDELESSWLFVIDNWKDGDDYTTSGDDFEDILELCGGDDYDLDEIEFDIEDEFKYLVKDFDKNKYTLVFWLDAEYDNECENEIKVTVDYYRSRDPVYTFLIR